jgi:hypothetical protein
MTSNRAGWCASQWQAHIERLPTYERRRDAVAALPEYMRERVISHLTTVKQLRGMK